ncbi:hypothetical protein LINPERHAP2_LOCUS37088 [Linum perenne]
MLNMDLSAKKISCLHVRLRPSTNTVWRLLNSESSAVEIGELGLSTFIGKGTMHQIILRAWVMAIPLKATIFR